MTLRTWHVLTATVAGVLFALMLFNDNFTWFLPWLAGWITAFFLGNCLIGLRSILRSRDRKLWNLSEFRHHQEFSIAAAEDVFAEEKAGQSFDLKVHVSGRIKELPGHLLTTPLSNRRAVAWTCDIEVFRKTRLGGDADFSAVHLATKLEPCLLEDGGKTLRLEPPGLLNAGHFREEFFTWKTLPDSGPLRSLIDSGMVRNNLAAKDYQGLRIRETFLEPGEAVEAWGQLTKGADGLTLFGNDILDDPGSLFLQAVRANEKKRLKGKISPLLWLNFALLALSGWGLAASIGSVSSTGEIQVNPGARGIEFRFTPSDQSPAKIWEFDANDTSSAIWLKSGDSRWKTSGDTQLSVWLVQASSGQTAPGQALYPVWQKDHWLFNPLSDRQPVQETGPIWVKNHLGSRIKLRFTSSTSKVDLSGFWALDAGAGVKSDPGIRLIFNSDGSNVLLTTGDQITLEAGGEVKRIFGLGSSPEITYLEADSGWLLDLEKTALNRLKGPVRVVQPAGKSLTLTLDNPLPDQLATVVLPPAEKAGETAARSGEQDWLLTDGQSFTWSLRNEKLFWQGRLQDCPWAKFEQGHWVINPPAGPQ